MFQYLTLQVYCWIDKYIDMKYCQLFISKELHWHYTIIYLSEFWVLPTWNSGSRCRWNLKSPGGLLGCWSLGYYLSSSSILPSKLQSVESSMWVGGRTATFIRCAPRDSDPNWKMLFLRLALGPGLVETYSKIQRAVISKHLECWGALWPKTCVFFVASLWHQQ